MFCGSVIVQTKYSKGSELCNSYISSKSKPAFQTLSFLSRYWQNAGPRHRGHSGAVPPKSLLVPPKQELCPPSDDCAPKKVTCLVPVECSSRPEPPKILVITPELVSKNSFSQILRKRPFFCFSILTPEFVKVCPYFAMKTFFLVFTPEFVKICADFAIKNFFCRYPRVCGILRRRPLFLGSRSRIRSNNIFVPPRKLFLPPSVTLL